MIRHDSWVFLYPDNPLDQVRDSFPWGYPVRDPFPMVYGKSGGGSIPLMLIDHDRLNIVQFNELAMAIAKERQAELAEVIKEAKATGGFGFKYEYVVKLFVGAEGFTRTKEAESYFADKNMGTLDPEVWQQFVNQQEQDWIVGEKEPDHNFYAIAWNRFLFLDDEDLLEWGLLDFDY